MAMIGRIDNSWHRFINDKPGQRFQNRYERCQRRSKKSHIAVKILYIILGIVVAVGSLILAPLPGPGWGTVFVGLMILAGEVRLAAVLLDWLEVRLRRPWRLVLRLWRSGPASRAAIAAITLLITATPLYLLYHILLGG